MNADVIQEAAKEGSSSVTSKMVIECSLTHKRKKVQVEPNLNNDKWWSEVTEVDFSHQGIRKIQNMDRYSVPHPSLMVSDWCS